MPPPTIYLAYSYPDDEYRQGLLKARYPDLYEDGFFCFTLDYDKCNAEGLLAGRFPCKHCKREHWKMEWPKEWRLKKE